MELFVDDGQRFLFAATAENSVVPDAHETFRKNVQRKPSDKIPGDQGS